MNMISSSLAVVAALTMMSNNVSAFSVPALAKHHHTSLNMWRDEFSVPPPTSGTVTTGMKSLVNRCLTSGDLQEATALLQQLEELRDNCTEEGHQTDDECDVALKDEREIFIHKLEEKISSLAVSTMVAFMSTQSNIKFEDQVKACIDGTVQLTHQEIKSLLQQLEDKYVYCTEDGHQTDDECDVVAKGERDVLFKRLERKLYSPDQIEYSIQHPEGISLGEWTTMMTILEKQEFMCTEEGHQTDDECDVSLKDERTLLLEALSEQIMSSQNIQVKQTKLCAQYQLCELPALKKTLHDLEEVNNLCTEDGNQTRSFCSLSAKEERESTMEQLRHTIELAENVVQPSNAVRRTTGGVSVFQI